MSCGGKETNLHGKENQSGWVGLLTLRARLLRTGLIVFRMSHFLEENPRVVMQNRVYLPLALVWR